MRHFALLSMTRYPPPNPLRKGGGLREKVLLVLREGDKRQNPPLREGILDFHDSAIL
ncbi:hypothetical protein [Helicobacter sp. T3_23-1059]